MKIFSQVTAENHVEHYGHGSREYMIKKNKIYTPKRPHLTWKEININI